MFMRYFGHGVGHQEYRWRQEVDTATEMEAGSGNDDDIEELDEHEEEIDEDSSLTKESEGEEDLGSESDDGCESDGDDLGYASF